MTAAMNDEPTEGNEIRGHVPPNRTGTALPAEIEEMFEFLSSNPKIVFKSQQINDPELQVEEKQSLARGVYVRNPQTFLLRFGSYLEEQHLKDFARLSIAEGDDEMHLIVQDFLRKLQTHQQDVKNRRYVAMQRLIDGGEYFSEQEMMKRAPELYQELVGQYLSSTEKQQRDGYDVRNTTFAAILMHTMEQKEMSEIMKQAEENIESESKDEKEVEASQRLEPEISKEDTEVPVGYRQQWGNFDNEQRACSTSRPEVGKRSPKPQTLSRNSFITAGERDLLRQEFIGLMHERFLAGQDADFDYASVDDNSQMDDLRILNQDREDAYFESSDTEEEYLEDELAQKGGDVVDYLAANEQESEDELDIYMSHLSKHHSL